MQTIDLAKSDRTISRLGLGGAATGGHGWGAVDDTDSIEAIRQAYDQGITFYDTADVYGLGHAEEILAKALGHDLQRVTFATKFGVRWESSGRTWRDSSPNYLRQALDASLRRLRVEQIPLYYVHWPDGVTPLAATLEELLRQQQLGKIGHLGLSNHTPQQVAEAQMLAPIASVQVQFSLLDRDSALTQMSAFSKQANPSLSPTLVTWGSLAEGLLTGKYNAQSKFKEGDRRNRYRNFQGDLFRQHLQLVDQLQTLAKQLGKTPAQTAIRWLLDTPGVGSVLFGAKTPKQVDDNLAADGWSLPREAYTQLQQASPAYQKAG